MVICFGYEFSPNMMSIQEGYNKNFHLDGDKTGGSRVGGPELCVKAGW